MKVFLLNKKVFWEKKEQHFCTTSNFFTTHRILNIILKLYCNYILFFTFGLIKKLNRF